jgi:hypothetical protein
VVYLVCVRWLQTTLVLAWLWLYSSQTFGQRQFQEGMVCPKSASHSLQNMVTSLIAPIWRKWNPPAVVCCVCWLQTTLVLLSSV